MIPEGCAAPPALGLPSGGSFTEKTQSTTAGTRFIRSNSEQIFCKKKVSPLRISLKKTHLHHLTTKVSGSLFWYGGPGHNPIFQEDFSLASKAEIHHFYYVGKMSTPSPNLQFSFFKNRMSIWSINKQIC